MNDKYKFEHEKPDPKIEGHVSTPPSVAKLLVELTGINQVQGQIVYDFCVGVGGISSQLDFSRNVVIGDDSEIKYLKICQKNLPKAILFHHDTFKCQKMAPCYEHLVSQE
jgi:tRNA G10  N-methylase Trm11